MLSLNSFITILFLAVLCLSCGGSDRFALGFPLAGMPLEESEPPAEKDPVSMASIPSGCFQMGDSQGDSQQEALDEIELPVHEVCLSAFQIDVYEVTNSRYVKCIDEGTCAEPHATDNINEQPYLRESNFRDYPVVAIDWKMASDYCGWAGKRLPTEAEWERAARGGKSGQRFPWGDFINCGSANYWANVTSYTYDNDSTYEGNGACVGDTIAVGSYSPNSYDLYDMAGNVSEWTADWGDAAYYANSPQQDPQGPESGSIRIFRGGSFLTYATGLRNSYRAATEPTGAYYTLGFRCVR